MADQKKQNTPAKRTYTPEQTAKFRKDLQERKLQRAGEKDTQVVNISTIEAADTTQFIDKVDYTMSRLRMTFASRRSSLSPADFLIVSGSVTSINNQLNLFLCKANKLAGLPYKPPRGYVDLTKQSNLDRAAAELDETIEQLMNERDHISKQISSRDKKLAEIAEASAAKKANEAAKKAATSNAEATAPPAKKALAKAKADAGEPISAAA